MICTGLTSRDNLAHLFFASVCVCARVRGSDPHPGNIIRMADQTKGKIALIDFGLVASLQQQDMDNIVNAIVHLSNKDYAALVDDFVRLQILPADCDRAKVIPLMDKALSPCESRQALLLPWSGASESSPSAFGLVQVFSFLLSASSESSPPLVGIPPPPHMVRPIRVLSVCCPTHLGLLLPGSLLPNPLLSGVFSFRVFSFRVFPILDFFFQILSLRVVSFQVLTFRVLSSPLPSLLLPSVALVRA